MDEAIVKSILICLLYLFSVQSYLKKHKRQNKYKNIYLPH